MELVATLLISTGLYNFIWSLVILSKENAHDRKTGFVIFRPQALNISLIYSVHRNLERSLVSGTNKEQRLEPALD